MNVINNTDTRLIDRLNERIKAGDHIDLITEQFSMYAYQALKEKLRSINSLRLLYNKATFTKQSADKKLREFYIPRLQRERGLHGNPLTICSKEELESRALAIEFAQWLEKKCEVRSLKAGAGHLPSSLTLGYHTAYTNFSAIDEPTLGLKTSPDRYMIVEAIDDPIVNQCRASFEAFWHDDTKSEDVKKRLINSLKQAYEEHSPEFIYYLILSHLFAEQALADNQPREVRGFKESVIWGKLFDFQRDAVLAIISKLEQYNGCILADSVGLGKTFTALGVIKYYAQQGLRVLVLCPKKLCNNWQTYTKFQDDNILSEDALSYDVLAHTDLSRKKGISGMLDLERLKWGEYGLVVIDESHNFRNGGGGKSKMNRYDRLMERVIRQGANTKVLMLSATPVNNGFTDLKNQIALAYAGEAGRLEERIDEPINIEQLFKDINREYRAWARLEAGERTKAELLARLPESLFTLLDAITIARSRRHITEQYDASAIGQFPKKLKPKNYSPDLIRDNQYTTGTTYKDIADQLLNNLEYSVYRPLSYLRPEARHRYVEQNEQGGDMQFGRHSTSRERGLCKLMATTMLKRLESSASSFCETITSVLNKVEANIRSLEEGRKTLQAYDGVAEILDEEEGYDEELITVRGIDIADIDCERWLADLKYDQAILEGIIDTMNSLSGQNDTKLQTLIDLIIEKRKNPINEGNHKVLVFTAFADTANYLYDYLAEHKPENMQIGLVTGQSTKSTIPEARSMEEILCCFSPRSKSRDTVLSRLAGQDIDILIATDCISEGQNLQDCDYVVNYDIHWNPVRIVQRFGRVDRIGSPNEQIQLVNFWPAGDLEDYIKLRSRVEERMTALVVTATGHDNPMQAEGDEEGDDIDYRDAQLRALKEQNLDLEDMNDGISIMDLGLGNYREELIAFSQAEDIDRIPNGLHAVVSRGDLEPGVIYCLRNKHEKLHQQSHNKLYPYYLLYVAETGEVKIGSSEPKRILEQLRKLCKGTRKIQTELLTQVEQETQGYRDMSHYAKLLQSGISSIVETSERRSVEDFLSGNTVDFSDSTLLASLQDFELIAFLILK